MNYVVAVSGGVDSVVLLDMLVREKKHDLTVAHFDHGIRDDSAADARFVEALAKSYDLPYVGRREELGKQASEDYARQRRYEFLRNVAKDKKATLVTAHHADDIIETIAINFSRGTGWRGLAVFGDDTIERPLLSKRKSELYDYALLHDLEWVEDSTNQTDTYLRNRIRRKAGRLSSPARSQLLSLYDKQRLIAGEIDTECQRLLNQDNVKTSRYFFTNIDHAAADELLRAVTEGRLTRPQRERLLGAIKTAKAGALTQPGSGVTVHFTAREFIVAKNL